ncbi:MAG TPA: tRNA (adenosine(37)-N6)-dimethylallyltransferase MiaA [Polyangiaceae bacterium]
MPHASEADPLLVVVGPTASGKTDLAIALAEALHGEILSADSVQIYRHFDIGSGKPNAAELARAPHHFIDALDPFDSIDAAGWADRAEMMLLDIVTRGQRPIVCGGSFLWVRALLFGLAKAPPADPDCRTRHREISDREGRAALHARLLQVDPQLGAKLAPNDFVRVSRALEVYELTGVRMSQWQAEHGFREPKRPYRLLGVARERAEQDERIRLRAARMLEAGLVSEVVGLCQRGYGAARAMGSVGYREVHAAIEAGHADDQAALLDAISSKTRVFARRQRTWLRDEPVRWIAPELTSQPSELVAVATAR